MKNFTSPTAISEIPEHDVENDVGEVVRSVIEDTDALAQYQTMRETLVFLTHLNYEDTESIM